MHSILERMTELSIMSEDAADWYRKGINLYKLGCLAEALDAYDEALKLKPDYIDAWYKKGVVLGKLERHEEAIRTYEEVIKLKPDIPEAWCNKGNRLVHLNRQNEALKFFVQATKLKPDYAHAWYNTACIYAFRSENKTALAALHKALNLDNKYKLEARTDKYFRNLQDDKDFKKIIS